MNDQLQQALAQLITKTMDGVEAGAGFLQAEIPDVIQQLLVWKMVQASIMTILCAMVIVCFVFFVKTACVNTKEGGALDLDSSVGEITIIIATVISGVSAAGCFTWGHDALMIWLAPKIYLIEYAASLAK